MTPELPDDAYLRWLYSQVASVRHRDPSRTYWSLFRALYTKEFLWFIPNDDNRVEDGRALREQFMQETGMDPDREWLRLPCSMLEMLIALSTRLAFEAEGQPRRWFWHLLQNLGLQECNDAFLITPVQLAQVDEILDNVIWRRYDVDGHGGLFPLQQINDHPDQTKVELWYQMNAYLLQ